jgi:hypothetical protein
LRQEEWSRVLDTDSGVDMDRVRLLLGRDGVGQESERVPVPERQNSGLRIQSFRPEAESRNK